MKKLFLLLMAVMLTTVTGLAQVIHGTVVSAADDEPLVGASIVTKGSGATVTDIDGKFAIHVAPGTQITVSYVGYATQTLPAAEGMVVKLAQADNILNDVVVTGYGTGKKLGSIVGSVNVVGTQTLEDTPSANFVDALQGQVPGLAIFSNTGEPSSVPSSIRIRGVNSLSGNTPLFICDGAPATSSIFTTLNPSDIESVTVLKDAASTAIYGSRAANGVIVITTKKGRYSEDATVTVRANAGWSSQANDKIDMMTSEEFVRFRDLVHTPVSNEVRDFVNKYGINTDWKDYLIKDHALLYSVDARIQGGTEKTRYYLSLADYYQDGLIDRSDITRQTLRFNLDSKLKNWLQVGISANVGFEKYATNNAADSESSNNGIYSNNPFYMVYNLLPYDSPYYYSFNQNGDIVFGDRANYYHYSQKTDPNYFNRKAFNGKRTNLTAMVTLYEQIMPVKGLTIRAQQNVNAFDYRNSSSRPQQQDEITPMGDLISLNQIDAYSSEAFQRWYQFTYTNTAEYKFTINDAHDLSFLIGQESIITRNHNFGVSTSGQPNYIQNLLTQGTTVTMDDVSHGKSESIMNSYFLTGSYSFADKYFLDAAVRRDGSSKFAPGHRWGTFWSVGAMWDMAKEEFIHTNEWFSDLKLRVNYGTAGNSSGIGNYDYFGTVGSGSVYNGNNATGISGMSNDHLTWETVKSFDVGVDADFFNSKLRGSVDFYVKNTENMLMEVPYSFTTGWSGGTANVGSMRNMGVDVDLHYNILQTRDWYVGLDVNFGYNKNTITELFNGLESFTIPGTGITYRKGQNPFTITQVRYAGVDPRDGQQMWYTKDGNLTKHYDESNEVDLGKSFIAPWNGGFGINARWKGLSLRADFNWSAKKYIFNATNWYIRDPSVAVQRNTNAAVELLNVWTKPGDVTDIPNIVDLYGVPQEIQPDSRWVESSSFLRLKNLTIAYSLPKTWMDAVKMKDVTLHFTGRNLLTFTSFNGVDPEYEGNVVQMMYPNTRQFEFGLEVSF
ncbi:MAG: TonB-dependent receptor [Bacteroidales bacterium]|nr:TonB-dependent receptor [Bacteroidales bacterium]